MPPGTPEGLFEPVHEQSAVGQLGEFVVGSLVLEALLEGFLFCYVVDGADHL
jgi:hypothetical protein